MYGVSIDQIHGYKWKVTNSALNMLEAALDLLEIVASNVKWA